MEIWSEVFKNAQTCLYHRSGCPDPLLIGDWIYNIYGLSENIGNRLHCGILGNCTHQIRPHIIHFIFCRLSFPICKTRNKTRHLQQLAINRLTSITSSFKCNVFLDRLFSPIWPLFGLHFHFKSVSPPKKNIFNMYITYHPCT